MHVLTMDNHPWHIMCPPAEKNYGSMCGMSEYHLCYMWCKYQWDKSSVNRTAPARDTVWQVSLQRRSNQPVSCKLWPFLLCLGTQCQSESVPVLVSEPTWPLGRQHYLINHIGLENTHPWPVNILYVWYLTNYPWRRIHIKYIQRSRLTSFCPCPSWMAVVSSLGVHVPSVSQLPPFSYWRHSSPLLVLVVSLPNSFFHPGASAWAARTSHEARDDDDVTLYDVRQTKHVILSMSYFMMMSVFTSFSFSFSSASVTLTLLTNICLISSSLRCSSERNSILLASYVSWRLKIREKQC